VVAGFGGRVEVMDYFYGLRENPDFFGFDRFTDNIIVLSESNMGKFYLSGLVNDYKLFFDKYFLQHIDQSDLEKVSIAEEAPKNTPANSEAESKIGSVVVEPTTPLPTAETEEEKEEKRAKLEPEQNEREVEINEPIEIETTAPPVVEPEVAQELAPAPSIYALAEQEKHRVLVIVKKTRMDYNRLQKIFAAHTRNNFDAELKVQLLEFGTAYRMIAVDGFANANEAMAYIKSVKELPYLLRDVVRKEHYVWAVGQSNMQKLEETNEMQAYDEFFKANY